MAKNTTGFDFTAFDLDAVFAFQRANFETLVQAQNLVAEATRNAFEVQTNWANKMITNGQKAFEAKEPMKPETYIGEAEAFAKEAMKIAQGNVELGVQTHRKVSDLVAKRVEANIEELKKHAA